MKTASKRMRSSRRRFLKIAAAGGVALLGAAALPLSVTVADPAAPGGKRATGATDPAAGGKHPAAAHTPTPAMRKEIQDQKDSFAKSLKTIREHRLDPGSPLGFTFQPVAPRRKGRKP